MNTRKGKLIGIARRAKSRAKMEELDQIEVTTAQGITGDFRGKPGTRQVTLVSAEDWKSACVENEVLLRWTARRANLLVEGIQLVQTKGWWIQIEDVILQITGETRPCHRMDEMSPGLCSALTPDWRGGVCCEVIVGGTIMIGDKVILSAER